MKKIEDVIFDAAQYRKELEEFGKLLRSKESLSERSEVQWFFKERRQLSAYLGTLALNLGIARQLAFEFPIVGDFAADIVLGDRRQGEFCLVELEDASPESIFSTVKNKSTKEWSRRFEHGFSQLIDWFYALDDLKKTNRFARDFGHGHTDFFGILLIGRNSEMSDDDRTRLRWRSGRVRVDSYPVYCLTFDDLYQHLRARLDLYTEAFKLENADIKKMKRRK